MLQQLPPRGPESVAFCVALLERESAELAAVVDAWKSLAPAVKAGIIAMVQAAR